jgi:hypothetical protein
MGAAAIPADTADAPTPEALVQAELIQSLTAGSVEQQERAARRIRAYAHTHRYPDTFFQDVVRPLHDLVAAGSTEEVRVTAVSALSAIGTDVAMIGLQMQTDEIRSDRLSQALQVAFDRYAAEHMDDTRRTQVIK